MAGVRVEPIETTTEMAEESEAEDTNVVVDDEAEESVGVSVVRETRVVEVSTEEAGVTRRQFFNRAITGTFGAFLGFFGLYSLAFLWPKLSGGFGADINAGPVTDLASQLTPSDGGILPLFVPEARAYIVPAPLELSDEFVGKNVEAGGLMALFQRCVHLGCRVPWCGPSQGFECPCHGSKYNSIGEYFAGPAPRNLDRLEVLLDGNNFIIKTGSIIQTPRAPVLSVAFPQGPSCIGVTAAGETA
jgi:cytochrome b6-f complex iron-sulfur subunit